MLAARTGAIGIGTARTIEAIRARGLTLEHDGTRTAVPLEVAERLDRPVSLLVVAVKAYALDEALDRVPPETVAGAVVLPLLNGLEHIAALRRHFEACVESTLALPCVVAGSISRFEGFSSEPGLVVQVSAGATITAGSAELRRERLEAALAPLRVPGLELVLGVDERTVLWEKAARLAVLAAATAASGESLGHVRSDPVWRARLGGALAEACAVAEADGVPLELGAQWVIVEALPATFVSSTARDVAAGRRSELDAIIGSVVRAGGRLGVPTPLLETLLADALSGR